MLNLSRCAKNIGYTTLWELTLLPSLVIVIVRTFVPYVSLGIHRYPLSCVRTVKVYYAM